MTTKTDTQPSDSIEANKAAGGDCVSHMVCNLPFSPPFRVISEYRCGTDAHIVDSAGNIIIESSSWVSEPDRKHKKAMTLICSVLNEKFPVNETSPSVDAKEKQNDTPERLFARPR